MAKQAQTKSDLLNNLFKKCGLSKEDIFSHKNMYKIITRSGIEKIQSTLNIDVDYTPVDPSLFKIPGEIVIVLKTMGVVRDDEGNVVKTVTTFGEANDLNLKQKQYPFAMAEKRGLSRAVLKLAGLYEHGVFGEDEADDFGETVKQGRQQTARIATIKRRETPEGHIGISENN